jgi:hypothetical protein
MWVVSATEATKPPYPTRVVYGQAPPTYVVSEGPHPLTPGCYRAWILGTGATQFVVQDDGKVVEQALGTPP